MKYSKANLIFTSLAISVATQAAKPHPKVVYGEDDRVEVYESTPELQKIAKSTAAMVEVSSIMPISGVLRGTNPTAFNLPQSTLGQDYNLCPTERFFSQPDPAMCSGFLVGPDLLVTAGHCADSADFCETYSWVFGFEVDPLTQKAGLNLPAENVYNCKKVINQNLNDFSMHDHALIQLDRVVVGRAPLKFRSQGKINVEHEIAVIGHPSGLPTKIADGAFVRESVHPNFFVANLDTFQGNSGSIVVNLNDYTIEGILVRGERDYRTEYTAGGACRAVNVCREDNCRGEDVTRITTILELEMRDKLIQGISKGEIAVVKSYLEQKGFVDMYDNSRESLLFKAVQAGQQGIVDLLLEKGADANHVSLDLKSPLHAAVMSADSLETMEKLMLKGSAVNKKDKNGVTPLMIALENLKTNEAELLLKNAASLEGVMINGESPLIYALKGQSINLVKLLIDNGVDVLIRSSLGQSALELALKSKQAEAMKILISKGANVSEIVGGESLLAQATLIDLDLAQILVDGGADINGSYSSGLGFLVKGIKEKDLKLVSFALKNKVDLTQSINGVSAMELSLKSKDLTIAKMLIAAGANVKIIGSTGEGLLAQAVRSNDLEKVKLLLAQGVSVDQLTARKESVIFQAIRNHNLEMTKFLVENKANLDLRSLEGFKVKKLARKLGDKPIKKYLRKFLFKRAVENYEKSLQGMSGIPNIL
jgi:ankyrin repeat protein/V8-like Glu-specific endopeptidase